MPFGSILNLEPGAEYECRYVLSDPNGVKEKAEKTVSVRTGKEPKPGEGGHVFHVYPFGYKGSRQEAGFTGLLAAYCMGSDQSDHSNVSQPRVQAGDTILVHAGIYKDNWFVYSGFDQTIAAYGTPFDCTYYLTQSGTPEKPIVIRAAGDGDVVFDGDGNQSLFNLMGANSRLENVGRGVEDQWSGSKNFYIADKVFIGRHDPNKLQSWWTPAVWSKLPGYPALITSYGDPDGTPNEIPDRVPVAIDFYNNDLSNMADSCMEADAGAHEGQLITRHFKSLKVYRDKSDPQRLYKPEDFDFRLKAGSAAINTGVSLPPINDDFTGRAPDLGAYELDRPLPHYGPR